MNQKFKSGKKVLSLVLSVLMLMSCLVFAPVVNAAETLPKSDVDIVFDCTNEMTLKRDGGSYTLRVDFEDGTSETINLFGYNGKDIRVDRDWPATWGYKIGKKKTTFTITGVTSKVKAVYMAMNIVKEFSGGKLVYKIYAYQNGQSLGNAYSFNQTGGKFSKNEYIFGGDSGNSVTSSTAKSVQFTEKVTSATIDNGSLTAQFKAVVVDQFGVAMSGKTVTYSVSPTTGASINSTGLATFSNKATTNTYNRNTYTVTAKNGTLSATATIYVTNEQFDVTFNYKDSDGNDKSTTVSGVYYSKAATAPTDYATTYSTADGHMTFTKWDKAFNKGYRKPDNGHHNFRCRR